MKFLLTLALSFLTLLLLAQPDTTINRKATTADAAYWPSVNIGDYIFFKGTGGDGKIIYSNKTVRLNEGKKILIWRGNYERIFIDGTNCFNSKGNPTTITNLGGQVKWGYSEKNAGNRTLELKNFNHVFLTGKYDSVQQTGDPRFLGHNDGKNMGNGNYHQEYGMWGNPKWSGVRFHTGVSNITTITKFRTCKVSYVAASEGGFAGFNLKTDNPSVPGRVEVDVQDCFVGWTESEGFYISWSTGAEKQNLTKLTLKNNILAFTGTEALQTDNLTEGSVIENNVVFVSACFHRRPFMDLYQDGLHQFSFVEGGITVQNNIMLVGSNCHQIRYKNPGTGRANPEVDKPVLIRNNYYGYTRSSISYVWEGDGITPYNIENNIYGPVYTPSNRDAYRTNTTYPAYVRLCNQMTKISYQNNIYPPGRALYKSSCGTSKVVSKNNQAEVAPLLQFKNSGFSDSIDYRDITIYSQTFQTADKKGVFIPYKVGDVVFYYDQNGTTKFYRCIEAHAGDFSPLSSENKWQLLLWNGKSKPPLDLRLKSGNYYFDRNMGLDFPNATTSSQTIYNEKMGFSVYPNPARGFLNIELSNNESAEVRMYSVSGETVLNTQITGKRRLSTTSIDSGLYFLQVIVGRQVYNSNLVVVK